MMFKRKQTIKNMQEEILVLGKRYFDLKGQTINLKQKIRQLECKHNFTFCHYGIIGIFKTNCIHHRCTECGKTTMKIWDNVAKKGQQALKLLNLVPKDWKIKGDK